MKNPMRNDAKWCEIFLLKKGKKVCCPYRTDGEIHRRNDQKAHLMDQELLSHCLCHFAHEKPHAKWCEIFLHHFASFRICLNCLTSERASEQNERCEQTNVASDRVACARSERCERTNVASDRVACARSERCVQVLSMILKFQVVCYATSSQSIQCIIALFSPCHHPIYLISSS